MGIQTTYKCDNNGCGKTTADPIGWFGVHRTDHSLMVSFYGPQNYDASQMEDGEMLACSEGCTVAIIQKHLAAHRAVKGLTTKGGPNVPASVS